MTAKRPFVWTDGPSHFGPATDDLRIAEFRDGPDRYQVILSQHGDLASLYFWPVDAAGRIAPPADGMGQGRDILQTVYEILLDHLSRRRTGAVEWSSSGGAEGGLYRAHLRKIAELEGVFRARGLEVRADDGSGLVIVDPAVLPSGHPYLSRGRPLVAADEPETDDAPVAGGPGAP